MDHWKRLALPCGLGLVAAVLNWAALYRGVQPTAFVRVTRDVPRGEVLTEAAMEKFEIRGDLAQMTETAHLYRDRHILYQQPVTRHLKAGELILWQDTQPRRELVTLPVSLRTLETVPRGIAVGQEVYFRLVPAAEGEDGGTSAPNDVGSGPDEYQVFSPSGRGTAPTRLSGAARITDAERVGPFRVEGVDAGTLAVAVGLDPDRRQFDPGAQRLVAALTGASTERIAGVAASR